MTLKKLERTFAFTVRSGSALEKPKKWVNKVYHLTQSYFIYSYSVINL